MKLLPGLERWKDHAVRKISHQDAHSTEWLCERLQEVWAAVPLHRQIILVCIGTDRSTGDSLGPLVGSQLLKAGFNHIPVYGTLDEPVHAMNLNETLEEIERKYDNPFIVAIDACLGQLASIGYIQIGDGPVKPGAGVNKELPPVGDMHITGIVNVGGFMEYFVLQNTRLSLVMKMAELISHSLQDSVKHWKRLSLNHSPIRWIE
jgi:putative sporulation protein YyaC